MTVQQLLTDKKHKKESELLLAFILDKDRIWIHLNGSTNLEQKEIDYFEIQYQKLLDGYPFEYLIGKVSFYSEEFFASEGVLIARPETEILVDKVSEIIKKFNLKNIVEIGSGSGIIPIVLALQNDDLHIVSGDINGLATKLSQKNLSKFALTNIEFIYSDLFANIVGDFDLCVSNPPYIQDGFKLPTNVQFEPSNALFGGSNGDEILKKIIDSCVERKIRFLCCEMGYDQKESIFEYLKNFSTISIEFYKDLAGFDRGFCVEFEFDKN